MLVLRNPIAIEFKQSEFDYFKSLVGKKDPSCDSPLIAINFSGKDLGAAARNRNVYEPHELENDLPMRVVAALGLEYLDFMLVYCVPPGIDVKPHTHRTPDIRENHFQTTACISPNNRIKGIKVGETMYDVVGTNNFVINVKMLHDAAAQEEPVIWMPCYGGRLKCNY